jgi:hypothetical protein
VRVDTARLEHLMTLGDREVGRLGDTQRHAGRLTRRERLQLRGLDPASRSRCADLSPADGGDERHPGYPYRSQVFREMFVSVIVS